MTPDRVGWLNAEDKLKQEPFHSMIDHGLPKEAIDKMPFLLFSPYTAGQIDALERKATELSEVATRWSQSSGGSIQTSDFWFYYDNFWFWILGAYEVVRTMDQYKMCFTIAKQCEIRRIKKELSRIRVPFAKQELANRAGPIYAELSVMSFEKFTFLIEGKEVIPEELTKRTMNFFRSFHASDIVARIPQASTDG